MKHKKAFLAAGAVVLGLGHIARSRRKAAESIKITPEKAKAMIASGKSLQLVDVREKNEYEEGHIPGALLMPLGELHEKAPEELSDKETLLLVYCRTGRRSAQAVRLLTAMGYDHTYDLGGILSWPYELEKGEAL